MTGWRANAGACCLAMLPAVVGKLPLVDADQLRRFSIAALAILVVGSAAALLVLCLRRRRKARSVPWITWNEDGQPVSAIHRNAENPALWHWGSLVVAGILGVSYSWITGQWIILPVFAAVGYWAGWRARKLLRH